MNPKEIRALRKKLGWSQREFAEKLGVSRNLIWYWESGQKSPSEDSLKRLAELAKTVSNSEEAVSNSEYAVSNSEENVNSENVNSEK